MASGSVDGGAGGAGGGCREARTGSPPPATGLEIYITVGEFSCHFEVGALQWVVVKKTLNIAFSNFYRNMYATLATVLLQHMLVYSW